MSSSPAHERLAVLAHEVRSPVAALSAIGETYHEADLDGDARRELARLALAACVAIDRIVTDAAVSSVRRAPLDVGALVRDTVAAAALVDPRVRGEVAQQLPLVEADGVRLRQALDNLVRNALAHSGASGDVVVAADTAGENLVLVRVSDSGRGIALDDQVRIFEAGVRLDPEAGGAGLGLALARAIVEAHGGRLSVSSAPGEGATFTIELPTS